jgi:hypothetical protein
MMDHGADRPCDFGRGQRGGGDLIQEGLEEVVITLIDKGDGDPGALQMLHHLKTAEPRADHDMVSTGCGRGGCVVRHLAAAPPSRTSVCFMTRLPH